MKSKYVFWFAVPSIVVALLSAAVSYSTRVTQESAPHLLKWLPENSSVLAFWLFVASLVAILANEARAYYVAKRQAPAALVRSLLEDFVKDQFHDRDRRKHRLTLFKARPGWRIFLYAFVRLRLFGCSHKWRVIRKIRWRSQYLSVYVRPRDAKNHISCAAWRINDHEDECEGVAGRVWYEGALVAIPRISAIDRTAARQVDDLSQLAAGHPVREYAERTGLRDVDLLKSCEHFATHFVGTLIRTSDGSAWGVLLLDSEPVVCEYFGEGGLDPMFERRFADCARVIGRLVG